MKMLCKRLTASMLVAALLLALLPVIRPQAATGSVSDWVLASEAPSWAQIVDRKYTYDYTTKTESTATTMDGYTCYGTYWNKTGSGSAHYATFPATFDQTHSYYTGFMKKAYTASETATTKREVSNVSAGYVYWHWMYDCGNAAASTTWRNIYYQKGTRVYAFKYFGAFVSTKNYGKAPSGTYSDADAKAGYQWYEVPLTDRKSYADTQGTRFWYRFNYYTSSYTDYQKIFQYTKTEQKESATYPTGDGVSNVKEWVKYLLQTNVSFDVNDASAPVNHMRAPTVEAGWTKNDNGTLSMKKEGVSVVYDPTDESFTFDTAGQTLGKKSFDLYRFALDEILPVGSYVNFSVRGLGGTQTLNQACLVLEGAPSNATALTGDRCTIGVFPPANGGWYTYTTGPLTDYQSKNIKDINLWLWVDGSAKIDQLKVQFAVSFTDRALSSAEIHYTPMEKSVFCNDSYGAMPEPVRTGYSFAGWYTDRIGGEQITAQTVMSRNVPHTLYAHWTANSYLLHLDAQGGEVVSPLSVTYDKAIGELPVPVREGYAFLGWYTEAKGGTLVKPTQIVDFTQERTIYACWIPEALRSCGEGLSWELEENRLTLQGHGAVRNYAAGASPFTMLSGYIQELVVEDGVTELGDYALMGLNGIATLHLPASLERLGEGALSGCTGLTTLRVENPTCVLGELPENVNKIVGYSGSTAETYATEHGIAFQSLGFYQQEAELSYWYRDADNTLYISGSGALPDYAIGQAPWYAKRLTLLAVQMSGNITYLGNNSFAGCERLSSISLPKSVKDFGENVFEDTLWYKNKPMGIVILNGVVYGFREGGEENNVVLSSGATKIESNFSLSARKGDQGLKSLQISSSVTHIEDGALAWFGQLSQLTVQNGNPSYRTVDHVLYSKDMSRLVCYPAGLKGTYRLPASVTQIRPYAFAGCTSLTELHLGREVTMIGVDAFAGSGLQTIYGYYGSYAWSYAQEHGYAFVPYTSIVTLDSNNGMDASTTMEINTGCAIGALPTPVLEGYRFIGWFLETEQEDLLVSAEFVVTEDMTLVAFWEEVEIEGPYLMSLSILSLPKKLDYFCGETLLTEGLTLRAHYSDGSVHTVTEGLSCVPARLNVPGSQLVTVYYAGKSVSFTVRVTEVVPVSLTLISLPKVLTYYVSVSDEESSVLNTQGLVGLVEFNNGTQRLINNSAEFEYIYDLSKPTDSTSINVNYRQGDSVVAAFYQVRVLEKPALYSQSVSGKTGEEISVPIYISGNVGLMGLGIELYYDAAVLAPESFSANIAGTMGWDKGYGEDGRIKILWSNSEETMADGMLATVTFHVLPDAVAGESVIALSYMEEDCFNGSYENVQFLCNATTVTVERVEKPTVYSEALTATAGDYLDVPVCYKNNVGIADISMFTLSYDKSALAYEQLIGPSDAVMRITSQEGMLKILLNAVSETEDDGVLFTLRFFVKEEAAGSYHLTYTLDDDRWECQDASVQVVGIALNPTISAEAQIGTPGETVSIPVELTENPGLMGYRLRLNYDPSLLTISAVRANAVWGGNFDYALREDVLEVLWTNSRNVTENGLIFTLELSAVAVGEYELQWAYVPEDCYNETWEDVALRCEPMRLRIQDHAHTEEYRNNADGSHDVLCPDCGELLRAKEAHCFVDGICACGAVQWTQDSNVLIQHSLNLASDISINFVVAKNRLSAYDSFWMECVLPVYEGNTLTGTQIVTLQPTVSGNYYYFTLEGMSAIRMNDMVAATLRMTKNGEGYCSAVDHYSVGTYAYTVLQQPSIADNMRRLCANLLRYGAAAQTFKGYRTDALVDGAMTQEHRAWLTDLNEVSFGHTDSFEDDVANPSISWVGKTLLLDSKVGIKYVFSVANYTGDLSELSMRVTYRSNSGEEKSMVLTDLEAYSSAKGYYSFTFYGLLAAELRQTVEVAIFRGETQLSKTMVYCADSYGSNAAVIGNLKILCQALFAYSDAALVQFSK